MNARAKVFSLLALIALSGLAPVAITGCQSTPKKIAYQTLSTVGALADTSMKAAAQAKKAGKLTDTQWNSIRVKHEKFRTSYNLACDVAGFELNNAANGDVSLALQDLLAVITSFGVQLP